MTAAAFPVTADQVIFDASPQLSAGRYFNARYAQIDVELAADVNTLDLSAAYTAKYGPIVAGKVIFFRIRQEKSGFTDVGQIVRCTVIP